MQRSQKVLVYATRKSEILLFRHTQYPEAGIQVPAGTIEPGEEPAAAAIRELAEESGVTAVHLVRCLGVYEYDMRPLREEIQTRHVFHVEVVGKAAREWVYYERSREPGGKPIEFQFFWVDLDGSDLGLIAGQGAFLPQLSRTLGIAINMQPFPSSMTF
jgi:8-oxo-dGTP pyrophosphatase MutT (NUDIX family)